jgi:hypothetical protein
MPEEKKWEEVDYIVIPSEKTAEISYWKEGKLKDERVHFERLNLEDVRIIPRVMLYFFPSATCTLDERGILTCRRVTT